MGVVVGVQLVVSLEYWKLKVLEVFFSWPTFSRTSHLFSYHLKMEKDKHLLSDIIKQHFTALYSTLCRSTKYSYPLQGWSLDIPRGHLGNLNGID